MEVQKMKNGQEDFAPLTELKAIKFLPPLMDSSKHIFGWKYNDQAVELPFSINDVDGQSQSYAKGTYDLYSSFVIHKISPTRLWFGQASQSAKIYVNDTLVAEHWGGYNSFFVDVSEYIRIGNNSLKVSLTNTTRDTLAPDSADFNFNATLGEVLVLSSPVLPRPSYGYDGFHITSNVTSQHAHVEIKTEIPTFAEITCRFEDEDFQYVSTKFGEGEFLFEIEIDNPHLWDGTLDPHLYNVSLEISYNGEVFHRLTTVYGLRFFSADSSGFTLNGRPYLLRGVCYHQDLLEKANALTPADIDKDFRIIKELGCNFVRCVHYPHPKQVYDYCDRMGIIVQTEVPWINKCQNSQPSEYWAHLTGQYTEMVNEHYNHPSIVFWGISNEISNNASFSSALAKQKTDEYYSLIKGLDSSRLVGYVTICGTFTTPKSGYGSPLSDWFGVNVYAGWYYNKTTNDPMSLLNACQNDVGNLPLAISEYGAGGTQDCHSETPRTTTNTGGNGARHDIEYQMWIHEGYLSAIRSKTSLLFSSLWNIFDFAVSDRREGYTLCFDGINTAIDQSLYYINDKGLIMRDHVTKKDTFYLYKAEWGSETFVHICQKSYTKVSDRVIKCYSNDGNSFSLYVNGTLIETVNAQNNIIVFSPRNFNINDEVVVVGSTASDSFNIGGN